MGVQYENRPIRKKPSPHWAYILLGVGRNRQQTEQWMYVLVPWGAGTRAVIQIPEAARSPWLSWNLRLCISTTHRHPSNRIEYPQLQQPLSEPHSISLKIAHLTVACMWQGWYQRAEVPHSVKVWFLIRAFRSVGKLRSVFGLLCYISCAVVL